MSFIKDPNLAENIDTLGSGDLLNHTRVTPAQVTAARSYLQRHGALDVAEMLGVAG